MTSLKKAAAMIASANNICAFTGAGISVESGIPPFRGEGGLWQKHDPVFIDLDYFYEHTLESWTKIKEIFYDFMGESKPNMAHSFLAELESRHRLQHIVTQNIDGLHQSAGSKSVYEFHGTTSTLSCIACARQHKASVELLSTLPPRCSSCGSVLKPDFIFFGEGIDGEVAEKSIDAASSCDLMIVIGTNGEVMPACEIPFAAKQCGASIIEINPAHSAYTDSISDCYLPLKAVEAATKLSQLLNATS